MEDRAKKIMKLKERGELEGKKDDAGMSMILPKPPKVGKVG